VVFSGFSGTQRYSLFLKTRENFGKIGRFRGKFPENHRNLKIRKSENFGKVPKRRFWKIQPSFAERFKTHILGAKIEKKK
jgi:hypothetical protein